MKDQKTKIGLTAFVSLSLMPLPAFAEQATGANPGASEGGPVVAATGGVPAIDSVVPTPGNPGVPLRFGNVLPKSERVTLGGRVLKAGTDYAMDYVSGVVYLYRNIRESESVTVEYRYDRTKSPVSSAGLAGMPITNLNLASGPGLGLGMSLGLGVTERAADGSVLRSNLFGTNNDLKLGAASLTGVYMVGQRSKVGVDSGFNFNADKGGAASTETGDSSFLVQSFRLGVAGGALTVDRQDISQNFTGFSALRGGGFDEGRLDQLMKEKGLVRSGMALRDAKMLGGAFTFGQRNVDDGKGGVDWREYGFASGGFKFSANTRRVDSAFTRFKDLAEGDRDQIAREKGLERGSFAGEFKSKTSALSFTSNTVAESATGKGATRREAKIDTGRFGLDFGDQTVDSGFKRFNDLLGAEKGQWGLEAGLHRQWLGLRADKVLGMNFNFRRENLGGEKGEFVADSLSVRGGTWSLEHVGKSATKGFDRLNSLSGAELTTHANEIAAMYNGRPFATDIAPNGGDANSLKNNAGIARTFDKLTAAPIKGLSVEATRLRVDGAKDGSTVETVALSGKNSSFKFRSLNIGENFGEITSLMGFERARLGDLKGLSRRDMQLDLKLAPKANLRVDTMSASVGKNGAERTRIAYSDPRLQLAANFRRVDKDFAGVRALVDDERNALADLAGYESREIALNWQALKNFRLEYGTMQGGNALDDREREAQNLAFDWQTDPSMRVTYRSTSRSESDRLKTIFAQSVERLGVSKRFGNKAGIEYITENRTYDGTDTKAPDSRLTSLALEARVSSNTTIKTVRANTDYSDGNRESVSTNSIQTTITPRVGVSVSDTKIARTADDKKDETKRDYGMWVDFGRGVRLSYGYVRSLIGDDAGASATTLNFGQNAARTNVADINKTNTANVNGTEIGFGSAGATWDDQEGRVQSFNNLRLKTMKPFGFLWMEGCNLLVDVDTASDKSVWIRENQRYAFSGKIGGSSLGFEYRGQTDPTGERASDRSVAFKTDPKAKDALSAAVNYKQRSLPSGDDIAIRDIAITARPTKRLEVTNQIQTNPETARSDALLGSVPRGDRLNRWKLDYKGADFTLGGTWEELFNDTNNQASTTTGVNLTLFTNSGSPVSLFYGLETRDEGEVRRAVGRYSLSFDQRPGPNQTLSMFVGNLSYAGSTLRDDTRRDDDWTVRLNYQLRF